MFAIHGIPMTIVSDNGASMEFKHFMNANGVNHCRVPPYHSSSNGAAKNLVRSVKRLLEKADKSASMQTRISRFDHPLRYYWVDHHVRDYHKYILV